MSDVLHGNGDGQHIDADKASPRDVAKTIPEAVKRGDDEILADGTAQYVEANLSHARGVYLGPARD